MLDCDDYIMYGATFVSKLITIYGLSAHICSVPIAVLIIHPGNVIYLTHANGAELLPTYLEIATMLKEGKSKLAVEEHVIAVVDSAT